jgi:hypothetical protein
VRGLRNVLLIEKRQLEGPAARVNRRRPQRSNPIEALDRPEISRSRASVSSPRSPTRTTRALPNRSRIFLIGRQRFGVARVALKHFDRDRAVVTIRQGPEDDPQFVPPALARMVEPRQEGQVRPSKYVAVTW